MALASQQLLAEPEQHVGPGLRLLLRLAADEDGVVVRLALMSCLLVFKDLLPGYRIRPPSEAELQVGVAPWVCWRVVWFFLAGQVSLGRVGSLCGSLLGRSGATPDSHQLWCPHGIA
jgi:hypothetical protein